MGTLLGKNRSKNIAEDDADDGYSEAARCDEEIAVAEQIPQTHNREVKDLEIQGIVLQFLYDHRREDVVLFGAIQCATEIPESIDQRDWLRACGHLGDYNLIEWDPFMDHTGEGVLGGAAKINAFGTAVVEGSKEPPIPIVLDQRQYINVISSQAVQIAGANSQQQQSLADAFEKVVNALDNANVSEGEKKQARSVLVKLLESKAALAILGPLAGEIIKRILG